jgi:hypothetical protein
MESGPEIINHDACYHGLTRSRNAWAEQSPITCVKPRLELFRIEQPFASSFLSFSNQVILLIGIVDSRKPLCDVSVLLFALLILLALVQLIHAGIYR